ncbi:MAG TPA: alkaline phosphatase family protein, partial [Alphaproteobacteria bacterium]|nr:alkaline phosphatase family protein [Alphaproteobacteria bacterium]
MPRRLLVIGCESADWSAIHPLTEAGTMPNLHRLIEGGASGVLTGLPPLQRDMLWTSVATGCRAGRHGVTGPTELRPDGGGIQPAGHRSWRAPAFWEILASAGIRTTVVNWPTTRPGRRWAADVIDDSFAQAHGKDFDDWPLPPDCAPQVLRATLRGLRIHPGDIAASEIAAFVPDLRAVDQATDPSLAQLAHILAESASVHAAATHLVAESPWQVLAVHYRLIDHTQRAFLQFKSDPAADPMAARPYGGVVDAAYRFQDMLIGRLLDLCGPDTDVLIVSPNGMSQSVEESTRPMPRAEGILVAHGPSTARDRIVHGATMFDIAPTILALFGV